MSTQTDRMRGMARAGASLLRAGARTLDRLAGPPGRYGEAPLSPPAPTPKDLDDVTIARKAESILFRKVAVDKGAIDVNAAGGVLYLRGVAPTPEAVRALVALADAIPEVVRVENLLHLPHTPAPTRTDTPPAMRKEAGRRTRPHSEAVHLTPDPITAERPVEGAEPSPRQHAATGQGRSPAPFGSHEPGR